MKQAEAQQLIQAIQAQVQTEREILDVTSEEKAALDSAQNLVNARVMQLGELLLQQEAVKGLVQEALQARTAKLKEILAAHVPDPEHPAWNYDVGAGKLWREKQEAAS